MGAWRKRMRWVWGVSILTIGMLGFSGCGKPVQRTSLSSSASATAAKPMSSVEKALRSTADRWIGTPHRLGGLDSSGIDCSGLVQRIYKETFNLELPRTTVLQVRTGRPVARGRWKAGDLIFFKPPWKGRHVGIYLSGNEFLHTSTSEGVTISRLDSKYWRKAYWTSRRLLSGK